GTLTNSGTITVDPPIYVSGLFNNTGSVNAPGTYTAFSITNGGVLTNAATGIITSGNDAVRTSGTVHVTNYGTITAARTGSSAVHLTGGGTVVNGSTANTSAFLEGYSGIFAQNSALNLSNFRTILANPTLGGVGANLDAGGIVINGTAGSTTALIAGGRFGVNDNTFKSTVINYGTITSTDVTTYLVGGGTVIDAGKIVGGSSDAIVFGAGSTGGNLLVLEHGYSITGSIVSVGTANNIVELLGTSAADAVAATYSSLQLANFGTIAFGPGPGNYATLRITNNAALPHTRANFTGIPDTVDLTALAYVSASTNAHLDTVFNKLPVTNGTTSVALQLGAGNSAGVSWQVANDGSGGPDVFVGVQPP